MEQCGISLSSGGERGKNSCRIYAFVHFFLSPMTFSFLFSTSALKRAERGL